MRAASAAPTPASALELAVDAAFASGGALSRADKGYVEREVDIRLTRS